MVCPRASLRAACRAPCLGLAATTTNRRRRSSTSPSTSSGRPVYLLTLFTDKLTNGKAKPRLMMPTIVKTEPLKVLLLTDKLTIVRTTPLRRRLPFLGEMITVRTKPLPTPLLSAKPTPLMRMLLLTGINTKVATNPTLKMMMEMMNAYPKKIVNLT